MAVKAQEGSRRATSLRLFRWSEAKRRTMKPSRIIATLKSLIDIHLPDSWSIIAAGNRESDRAVTHRMPSALATLLVHINFDVDAQEWLGWAQGCGVAPEVIAFIRFRPHLLHALDPQKYEKTALC